MEQNLEKDGVGPETRWSGIVSGPLGRCFPVSSTSAGQRRWETGRPRCIPSQGPPQHFFFLQPADRSSASPELYHCSSLDSALTAGGHPAGLGQPPATMMLKSRERQSGSSWTSQLGAGGVTKEIVKVEGQGCT